MLETHFPSPGLSTCCPPPTHTHHRRTRHTRGHGIGGQTGPLTRDMRIKKTTAGLVIRQSCGIVSRRGRRRDSRIGRCGSGKSGAHGLLHRKHIELAGRRHMGRDLRSDQSKGSGGREGGPRSVTVRRIVTCFEFRQRFRLLGRIQDL